MAVSPHTAQTLGQALVNVDAAQEIVAVLGGTSATLNGIPTAPTAAPGSITTQVANTTFVLISVFGQDNSYSQAGGL